MLRRLALAAALVTPGALAAQGEHHDSPAIHSAPLLASAAIPTILGAWKDHAIVAIGEVHQSRLEHDFLHRLIHAPAFVTTVNDIVIEFGNARYQPILDRYIAGDSVPGDSLRLVWRNTTQFFVWDSPLYEGLLRDVRSFNATLPREHRLRVLAGDPPVDWEAVRVTADFPHAYGYRDPDTFAIIEREVLAKQRRALVIIGNAHLPRGDAARAFAPAPLERAGLGDALAQRHPGSAFLVWASTGADSIARFPRDRASDAVVTLAGSPAGALNSHVLVEGNVVVFKTVNGKRVAVPLDAADFPPLARQVDALLFLSGTSVTVAPAAETYCDAAYVAELYRRAVILKPLFGYDFGDDLDALVKQAHDTAATSGNSCPSSIRKGA